MRYLLLCLTLSFSCYSAQTVKVVSEGWPDYTNEDFTGFYFDILRQVFPAPQWQLEIQIVPYKRAIAVIANGEADVTPGVYKGDLKKGLYSQHVLENDLVDAAVSHKVAANWQGISSLAGLSVVAKIGYGFDGLSDVKMKYKEKPSLKGMLQMLNSGRVAAVLDYQSGIVKTQQDAGIRPNYEIKTGVLTSAIFYGFADTKNGTMLKSHFDQRIAEMIANGELKALMVKSLGDDSRYPH